MPKWCPGEITAKQVWSEGLFSIRVRAPRIRPFTPGQFLQLGLFEDSESDVASDDEIHSTGLINRPYSVASPHGDEVEFFIVVVPDGELTPRIWALDVGHAIAVSEQAAGSFTLEKAPVADNLWLVATGTGLAPYIAMLRTETPWQNYRRIVLVHGVRHATDLAYTEELRNHAQAHPGQFHLIQALTREQSDRALHGRIPTLFEDGRIEDCTGLTCRADNSTVLLCGNPAMLDSMESLLGLRGMQRHRSKSPGQIVLERYW